MAWLALLVLYYLWIINKVNFSLHRHASCGRLFIVRMMHVLLLACWLYNARPVSPFSVLLWCCYCYLISEFYMVSGVGWPMFAYHHPIPSTFGALMNGPSGNVVLNNTGAPQGSQAKMSCVESALYCTAWEKRETMFWHPQTSLTKTSSGALRTGWTPKTHFI